MYLMATDVGVFCGQFRMLDSVPRMILEFEKVQQVHVLEKYQLLLVLADRILHHFPLDIVINGNPEQNQFFGRKIRSNVPYFHVGKCLDTTMIFVPKPYTVNGTEIDIYEPTMPKTEYKKKSFLGRLSLRTSSHLSFMNTQVNTLKPVYNPYNVWAIDNTSTLLLLSTHMGISAINMKTKKVDRLLDPKDELLYFVTKSQKIDEINPTKRVMSMFLVEGVRQYLICYDKYAFYIDKKGRRAKADFMITWEGNPTAFAYYHPYVMAFERNFIEIRDVDKGHLQQVIQEKNVHCLQNSHKSKEPIVLGSMVDKINGLYQHIFELQLIPKQQ